MHRTIADKTAKGPYATTVEAGGFVFLSGQGGIDDAGERVAGGIEAETRRTLENVGALLAEAGLSVENLVSVTCFLTDMADWPALNAVWSETLGDAVRPTRTAVGVAALPFGLCIEMTAVAYRGGVASQ